jgi:hypothetical protein
VVGLLAVADAFCCRRSLPSALGSGSNRVAWRGPVLSVVGVKILRWIFSGRTAPIYGRDWMLEIRVLEFQFWSEYAFRFPVSLSIQLEC